MKAKTLVSELNALLDNECISENGHVVDKIRIRAKKNQTSYKDELSSLINNYEMDGVEIGMISFLGEYKVTDRYLLFAKLELDLIGVDRNSREIVLLDHDNIEYVMIKCAKNSMAFLELLSIYSKYIVSRVLGNIDYLLPEKEIMYEIAGGESYMKFVDFCFE